MFLKEFPPSNKHASSVFGAMILTQHHPTCNIAKTLLILRQYDLKRANLSNTTRHCEELQTTAISYQHCRLGIEQGPTDLILVRYSAS